MNLTYNYQAAGGQMGAGSTAGNAGQLMSISGTINSTAESASYAYDLLGRLTESGQTSNGAGASRYFVYDRWGNRTQVQLDKESAPIQTITLEQSGGAPTNRITSVTSGSTVNYTYDAAGNVTNDGAHAYTYDAENRVVSVDGGATAQYRYDHQNRRVRKTVGSSWTHYIWEGAQAIAEHDGTTPYSTNPTYQVKSARLDYIYSGGRMIQSRQRASSTAPWATQYYLSDRLSVRMTLDTSGNILGRQAHLPFGEDFGESGTLEKHHLTSYQRDNETGTDYAINRQYAQSVGRFMQADAYKASGGIIAPQSWNRYSYVQNMPADAVDPLGLFLGPAWDSNNICDGSIFGQFFCEPYFFPIPSPRNPDPDPEPLPFCRLTLNVDRGSRVLGSYPIPIDPRSPDIGDPNTAPIGPGRESIYWYYFYEVIAELFGQDVETFTFLTTLEAVGTLYADIGGGQRRPIDVGHPTRPDNPRDHNVYTDNVNIFSWIDAPALARFYEFRTDEPIVSADVTFTFTFALIARGGGGCTVSLRLHATLEEGDNRMRWEVTPGFGF